jgi:hypothetical protein
MIGLILETADLSPTLAIGGDSVISEAMRSSAMELDGSGTR